MILEGGLFCLLVLAEILAPGEVIMSLCRIIGCRWSLTGSDGNLTHDFDVIQMSRTYSTDLDILPCAILPISKYVMSRHDAMEVNVLANCQSILRFSFRWS